jgi:5-methylcytosine-specific restriction endonuclease McrA
MTNKQRIREVIERLPDDVSAERAIEELFFWNKLEEGVRQADAGELIPHDDIQREFGAARAVMKPGNDQVITDQPQGSIRACPKCSISMPVDCYRKGAKVCVWCDYASKEKRAKARYRDKLKLAKNRVNISLEAFVNWYVAQEDCCAYCGLSYDELKSLRIQRGGGYCVAWDIDRIDSTKMYEPDNLSLSCFVCNMAKGDMLTAEEAKIVGQAVRKIWRERLKNKKVSSLLREV